MKVKEEEEEEDVAVEVSCLLPGKKELEFGSNKLVQWEHHNAHIYCSEILHIYQSHKSPIELLHIPLLVPPCKFVISSTIGQASCSYCSDFITKTSPESTKRSSHIIVASLGKPTVSRVRNGEH